MQYFISFITGVIIFYSFPYFPFLTVVVTLLSCIILALRKKLPFIVILLAGIAFAFIRYEPVTDLPYIRDPLSLRGVLQSYPTKTERGMYKQSLRIDLALNTKTGEKLHALAGQKIFLLSHRAFYPGTDFEGTARFLRKRIRLNPGARNNNEQFAILVNLTYAKEGRTTLNSLIQNYRYRLHRFFDANFSKDSGSLLKAITLNQKAEIDYDLRISVSFPCFYSRYSGLSSRHCPIEYYRELPSFLLRHRLRFCCAFRSCLHISAFQAQASRQ
jgi:hypothetical protein